MKVPDGLLEGILASNALWATHYKYLNDESEVELVKQRLVFTA